MRVGLLADIEQRAAIILDDLDEPALFLLRGEGNSQLRVLAQRHEFAAAHQHCGRARLGPHRRPRRKRRAHLGGALALGVDDKNDSLGLAHTPPAALGKCRRTAEQQQDKGQDQTRQIAHGFLHACLIIPSSGHRV